MKRLQKGSQTLFVMMSEFGSLGRNYRSHALTQRGLDSLPRFWPLVARGYLNAKLTRSSHFQ
jgi:hypothetical protein